MASEQLRKKWGVIFMGERETTPQELEAMREPVMRERRQRQEQENYLARVRAKAEERAREILGAAYAERQNVLAEARAEAEAQTRRAADEAAALKAQAQAALDEAEAERQKAAALREEAVQVLERSRHEGFQTGMEQAGAELKEFRAEVARMLGGVLRGLEGQRAVMCEAWREELAELTRTAVEAGTGWVLQEEHRQVLRSLVLESLHLLEDRATVTVRVHPDDEEVVGDMFKAARERVPELRQWIVEGDSTLEPGDIVAESVSGSVENLRAYYRELVGNILEHLTLPQSEAEAQAEAALAETVARDEEQLAAVVREAEPGPEPEPEAPAPEGSAQAAPSPGADASVPSPDAPAVPEAADAALPADMEEAPARDVVMPPRNMQAEQPPEPVPDAPLPDMAAAQPPEMPPPPAQAAVPDLPPDLPPDMDGTEVGAAAAVVAQPPVADLPEEALPPDVLPDGPEGADTPEPEPAPAPEPEPQAPPHAAQPAPSDNPSLAELEDELFPLPEEGAVPSGADAASDFFAGGGFLPGSEHQG